MSENSIPLSCKEYISWRSGIGTDLHGTTATIFPSTISKNKILH